MLWTIVSSVLCILAYPQIEWWPLAWVALVPFLLALENVRPIVAFRRGYLFGFLFFAGMVGWLVYVTYPGAFVMVGYLAIYPALFALSTVFFRKLSIVARAFILSSVWVVLEYVRSHAFSGFNWAMLGHSQYKNHAMIQIADITGAYGVSFLVMLVNISIAEAWKVVVEGKHTKAAAVRRLHIIVSLILVGTLAYGVWRFKGIGSETTVRIGVVQPGIPQSDKWIPALKPAIIAKTLDLTRQAATTKPDLIVWPETSLPGFWHENIFDVGVIRQTAKELNTGILMGVMTQEGEHYYNSSVYIDRDGSVRGRYDKIHLVPFGEYLPLRPVLGWLGKIIDLEDFTPGEAFTVFSLPGGQRFSSLICFEDTVGYLSRSMANGGAEFLVNMTNDAWFEDTKAPFVHAQAAVFSAIENHRSLVRAANTGFSGFINSRGQIIETVHNSKGKKTFVTGFAVADIPIVSKKSFYTKYGDIFTLLCFLGILWAVNQRKEVNA